MKRIFLLFVLFSSLAFSAADDCKTDVYFGNGILTKEEMAVYNAGILEDAIIDKFGIDYYTKHIGEVAYAYNSTHLWGIDDLFESLMQKISLAQPLDEAEKALMLYLRKWGQATFCLINQ